MSRAAAIAAQPASCSSAARTALAASGTGCARLWRGLRGGTARPVGLGRGRSFPARSPGPPFGAQRPQFPSPETSCVAALRGDWRPELPPRAHTLGRDGACRPCKDTELLLALCTSDFVIHGTIHRIAHDTELQASVITVAAVRVFRQKLLLFQAGGSGGPVQASIRTPLRCGVHPGPGTFLFVGWSHFGEAWLGCAPRFQDFNRAYAAAHTNHLCPFEVAPD